MLSLCFECDINPPPVEAPNTNVAAPTWIPSFSLVSNHLPVRLSVPEPIISPYLTIVGFCGLFVRYARQRHIWSSPPRHPRQGNHHPPPCSMRGCEKCLGEDGWIGFRTGEEEKKNEGWDTVAGFIWPSRGIGGGRQNGEGGGGGWGRGLIPLQRVRL